MPTSRRPGRSRSRSSGTCAPPSTKAAPGVVETIKWGMPHFEHEGVLCGMAAFKAHCAFGFWNRWR